MKRSFSTLFFVLSLAGGAAAADRWPACAPVLAFTATDIGVASYDLNVSTPTGAWVCLRVNRQTQKVKTVPRDEFESEFPGALAAANRPPGACQEVLVPPAPGTPDAQGQASCVSPKVFCDGAEITVRVSPEVAALPCPARLFSVATLIDDRLWVGIAPLDPYRREYPGAGVIVQVLDGSMSSRLTPKDIGARQVCAIRKDPYTAAVWGTTENGMVEFTSTGKVKRVLQMRTLERPAATVAATSQAKPAAKRAPKR